MIGLTVICSEIVTQSDEMFPLDGLIRHGKVCDILKSENRKDAELYALETNQFLPLDEQINKMLNIYI